VSCAVSAVSTDSGWQPRLAMREQVRLQSPRQPVGSDAAKARTIGGDDDMR
jgi:hypothetical protein